MAIPSILLSNGAQIPTLGLGTYEAKDPVQLETSLEAAFENGYRHFDTAYMYQNEHIIGKVLQKWFSSGKVKREELFITTKLPLQGVNPDRVEGFLNKSLKNLQLDYVDLYLIHFPICVKPVGDQVMPINDRGEFTPEPTDHAAVWKKLEEQVDAGKAKAIGISNFSLRQVQNILKLARIKPANLQIEIHAYLQQNELVDFSKQNGLSVVAYAPLGKGNTEASGGKSVLTDPEVLKLGKKYSKSAAQILLRFLLQRGIIVIPKSVTPSRVKENREVFDFTLDENDLKILRGLDKGEAGRVVDFDILSGFDKHPEWPLTK